MKKYIYIFLFFAIVANWDVVTDVLGLSGNPYTIGQYTSKKWYSDHIGYSEAIRISDENQTPALIYMHTDWCQYCKKFESELLTNDVVNAKLSNFVKIKINPEHSEQDNQLYKKLKSKGYPTIMFQHGATGKLTHVRAPYKKNGSSWKMMTANEFVAMLHKYGT